VGARDFLFSTSVPARPWAHTASSAMGMCSFPRVKRQERGTAHPAASSAEVTNGKSPLLPSMTSYRAGLTNLWHAYPQWHAERCPWYAAVTAVPTVHFFRPTSVSISLRICVYIQISDWVGTVYELPRYQIIWYREWSIFTQIGSGVERSTGLFLL